MDFEKYIVDIENFPKQGVTFKDITPLLGNAKAFASCAKSLVKMVETPIDKVVCVDARGFFFGGLIAKKLNAGLVPVRKKGKLPSKTIQKAYALEYGEDVLEIHADAIQKGDRVLIHDDVLATGGTAKAVCDLVTELGGIIVQCNFIIKLDFLKGEDLLEAPVKSLITY